MATVTMRRLVLRVIVLVAIFSYACGLKVNCAGGALASQGVVADSVAYFQATPGETSTYWNALSGSTPSVYRIHRWATKQGPLIYRLPADSSSLYFVTLRFAESYPGHAAVGKRVFSATVNGRTVADIDVFREAKALFAPYNIVFTKVLPLGNFIEVRLVPSISNAFISGIDITTSQPADAHRVIPPFVISGRSGGTRQLETQTGKAPTSSSTSTSGISVVGGGQFRRVVPLGNYKPTPRLESCAVWAVGKLWVLGGKGKMEVASYSPSTRLWTNHGIPKDKNGNAVELHHTQCVVIGTRIFAVGAWYGHWPREKTHEFMWVYDTATNEWSTEPHPPESRRRGAAAAGVYNGKIVLGGGSSGGHGNTTTLRPYLDIYDPATRTWTPLANIPHARDHTQGAVASGQFCVLGGRLGNLNNYLHNPVLETNCYDFASKKWIVGSDIPVGRSMAATGAICDGKILVAGGEGIRAGKGVAFKRVDIYDPVKKTFGTPSQLVQERHGTGAATTDCSCGNIYVASGAGDEGIRMLLDDIEVWSPDGKARNC